MSARNDLAEVVSDEIGYECRHLGTPDESVPGSCPDCWEMGLKVADQVISSGYRKLRAVTTVKSIRNLPALTIVVYDDMENGGPLQTYVVPDDGTVMFKDGEDFHLLTFGGDYIDAKDMPLPLTVVYEVGA